MSKKQPAPKRNADKTCADCAFYNPREHDPENGVCLNKEASIYIADVKAEWPACRLCQPKE